MFSEETHYKIFKLLEANPQVSQRELAEELGVSLGKANYCLRALIEKGWVKADNFRKNTDKRGYLYLLTPKGIDEKTRITARFLKRKLDEYESLKREIEILRQEVQSLGGAFDESTA